MEDINEEHLTVVPIHKHPQYKKQCCTLINEEWTRSETARMLSLNASCDKMPTSLVLVHHNRDVIGHCKITPIPSIKDSCFVESVVIDKKLRGRKLGTFLMGACEKYCEEVLKLNSVHLSTKGQEKFYAKLGYAECEPISIYGGFFPSMTNKSLSILQKTFTSPSNSTKEQKTYMMKPLIRN